MIWSESSMCFDLWSWSLNFRILLSSFLRFLLSHFSFIFPSILINSSSSVLVIFSFLLNDPFFLRTLYCWWSSVIYGNLSLTNLSSIFLMISSSPILRVSHPYHIFNFIRQQHFIIKNHTKTKHENKNKSLGHSLSVCVT